LREASQSRRRRATFLIDLVLIVCSYALGQALVSGEEFWITVRVEPLPFAGSLAIVAVAVVLGLWPGGGFPGGDAPVTQISRALGIGFLVEALLSYGRIPWLIAPPAMLLGSALCAVILWLWLKTSPLVFPGIAAIPRILFLGGGPVTSELLRYFIQRPKEFEIVGPLEDQQTSRDAVERLQPDRVVVEWNEESPVLSAHELLTLRLEGIVLDSAADAYELTFQRVCTARLHPSRFVFGKLEPRRRSLAWQAIYSNLTGLVLLVALLPLHILVWLALKITSPSRPAMVGYECVGFNHIPFRRLRFQTRSRLGRWIEWIGLAGLPQLLNVVRGEMALVGPEPDRVEFASAMSERIPFYTHRLCAKPGLTGWAQIHRPGVDTLLRLEFDLYYIRQVSPAFDLEVLGRTLFTRFQPRPTPATLRSK
jgi:lipopolysaccharide/colanic/teichoic acid biosynthesis glycosyltransferase